MSASLPSSTPPAHACLGPALGGYEGPLTILVAGEGGLGVLSQDPAATLTPILAPGLTPPGAPGCTGSLVLAASPDAQTIGTSSSRELVLVLLPHLTDAQAMDALAAGHTLDARFELEGRLIDAQLVPAL